MHPSATPWIWLGGSYPGVRGALLRTRNPATIYAAWAASAPVHAQADMAAYYAAAERSLARNCSADWAAVTRHVDGVLGGADEDARTGLKVRLLMARADGSAGVSWSEAENTSDVAAAGVLMDPLRFYQVRARAWRLH